MASHMRQEDDGRQRSNAAGFDAGQDADQVIDEGVHVEAQDVHSSRKYFYAPDTGKAKRAAHSHRRGSSYYHHHHRYHHHRSRRHSWLKGLGIAFLVLLIALCGVGGVGYVYGKQLYSSALTVKGQASQATNEANDLMKYVSSGDYESAQQSAQDLSALATQMQEELGGKEWNMAARVPVYGEDVTRVRTLASVFQDLSDNALIPMTDELSQLDFAAIVGTEGKIDVDALVGLVNAMGTVSDVISRNAQLVDSLGEAKIEQVNEPLQRVQSMLGELDGMTQNGMKIAPYLPQMLGSNGNTCHYLIVAQSPAEMRSTGGFAGSCGVLYVTDGKLELGDFASFGGLQRDEATWPQLTDEEYAAYGEAMQNKFDNLNYSPNFVRVGSLFAQMWENVNDEYVDGVVVIDPVFLQSVLALTGGVTADNGWEVDGSNAAEILMHTAYVEIERGADQDAFFAEVAQLAFKKFTSNIGSMGLTSVMSLIGDASQNYRLQAWMANPDEEAIMQDLGISGALETDPSKPVLGVYINDATWAKMGWYLDLRTTIDEGTKNADGSMTYRATTTLGNTITSDEAALLRKGIVGDRAEAPSRGSMFSQVALFPPAGGSITNVMVSDGYSSWYMPLYGFDVAFAHVWTEPQQTTRITYTVSTAPEAAEPLVIRMSPTARSFE